MDTIQKEKEIIENANIAFQTTASHVKRFEEYIQESTSGLKYVGTIRFGTNRKCEHLIFGRAINPREEFENYSKDENIARTLRRIYIIDKFVNTIEDLWKDLSVYYEKQVIDDHKKIGVRIQAMPQQFQQDLFTMEIPVSSIELKANEFDSLLHIYLFVGRLADQVYDEQLISRAYYKIKEASSRTHLLFIPNTVAVDLGAAPGGWSKFLVDQGLYVYSIDPSPLSPILSSSSHVTHIPETIEQCFPLLEQQNVHINGCLVCDINTGPSKAVEYIYLFQNHMENGAYLIFTFKNFVGTEDAYEKEIPAVIEKLNIFCHNNDGRMIHLFANGIKERTYINHFTKI
ncbi:hypothetical protein WA158_008161 [Blastocystis sp. Blastoise]